MKNFILTFFIALIAFSTVIAQRGEQVAKTFTDKQLQELTEEINFTMNSIMTTEEKDKLVVKIIKNYIMTSEADVIMAATPCGNSNTRNYIQKMQAKKFERVPASYISQNKKVNNTCEFNRAVQIYNMVGHELIANNNICSVMGCDDIADAKNPTKMAPVVTSERPKWKYTGVRRYFIEKEKYGWRYLCVKSNEKGKVILSDKIIRQAIEELEKNIAMAEESGREINNSLLPLAFKKHELAWKLVNQVDTW